MKKRMIGCFSCLLIFVYILSILPMLGLSFYAHPAHDDYEYSEYVYHALSGGGESVFSAAFRKVKEFYHNWQGTYSAAFLMALQPGAFSQDLYFLTTFVMLGALTAGTYVFARAVVRRVLGQKGICALSLAAAVLILTVWFVPDVHQGFYWWNGSMLYIFFYSISLVYYALLIRLFTENGKAVRWMIAACMCVLSVLIGGSNYSTALLACEITVLSALYALICKKQSAPQTAAVLLVLLAAFAVNILAPGNFLRAQEYEGMNPVFACVYSVVYYAYYLLRWLRLPVIACLLAFTPVFVKIAKKTSFRFRYPLLVIAFVVVLFSSQLTPSYYAMGESGPGRQRNIYYASAIWIYVFSCFYLSGWAVRRGIKLNFAKKIAEKKVVFAVIVSLMIAVGCVLYGLGNLPAFKAGVSLVNGEAKDYDRRYNEMLEQIHAADKICVTEGMDYAPPFLSPLYLSEDPDFWVNNQMEGYFGLEEIRHAPSEK